MPPAKKTQQEDGAQGRDRPLAATTQQRKGKNGAAALTLNHHGPLLREAVLAPGTNGSAVASTQQAQSPGMAWQTAPISLLNMYRVTHNLSTSAAFTSPLNQALLTNPGIGRQSPTMARRKEMRRVSREHLALAVRKNFNDAAVNEIDVVVDLMYRVRNRDKVFRMRSTPVVPKKQ